jgi:splicing factor 3B subunit 3
VMFNIGEVVTAIQSGSLNEQKPQLVFYCTIDGRVGIFYPFDVEESRDLTTLKKLEEELRKSNLVCATNHKAFRSFYHPQKGVIDGDFCKGYSSLSEGEKNRIANSLKTNSKEISLFLTSLENKFM